ncbi:MAG: helix-turn-helix domain-containing protein [bacterium]
MERQHQILEAASRLLLHYGPAKTTVADIAREAGISVGSVYLEFKSKDDILVALSSHRYAHVLAAMRAAAQAHAAPAERLAALLMARLDAFLRLAAAGDHAPDLLHCYCPAVEEAWQQFNVDERTLVTAVIAEGVAAGGLAGDPASQAEALLAACATLSPPLLCKKRPADVRERAERLHRLLLDGLRAR